MSREWKLGDVALITTRYGWTGTAIHASDDMWNNFDGTWNPTEVVSARPLVVIDPKNREQVERLADLFCAQRDCLMNPAGSLQTALREFANPKMPEPTGLGAVVVDRSGDRWVRHCPADCEDGRACIPWRRVSDAITGAWSEFDAVKVLSEGVPA